MPGSDPIEMTVATIRYRNYRGEVSTRRIVPIKLSFGATEHHPLPQWVLDAWDLDRPGGKVVRSFALADVLVWECGSRPPGASWVEAWMDERDRLLSGLKSALALLKAREEHRETIGGHFPSTRQDRLEILTIEDIVAQAERGQADG